MNIVIQKVSAAHDLESQIKIARYMSSNMRDEDKLRELETCYFEDTEKYIRAILSEHDDDTEVTYIASLKDYFYFDILAPVALFGISERWPGVGSVWCLTTKNWPKAYKAVTKFAGGCMLPAYFEGGGHRLDAFIPADRKKTQRWLTGLGFNDEGVVGGWGRSGRDYRVMARVRRA